MREHDSVVLLRDLNNEGLKAGDVGTIIHIHNVGEAFEVEFVTMMGRTVAIATISATDLRPVNPRDITHVRELQAT